MNCTLFEDWLNRGMPGAPARPAEAAMLHALTCPACSAARAAALEMEAALRAEPPPAPAGLLDKIMGGVAAAPGRTLPVLDDPLAWWVRAILQPAATGALVLAAVLTWALTHLSSWDLIARFAALRQTLMPGPGGLLWRTAWLVILLPGVIWLSWLLYRQTSRGMRSSITRQPF
jgi:hypothetical protein